MDVLYDWAPVILIFGLALTAVPESRLKRLCSRDCRRTLYLASTQRDMNDALRDALLRQSRAAAWGLGLVALGTIVQIAGTLIVMWSHLVGA
jgi:hypothetical protein